MKACDDYMLSNMPPDAAASAQDDFEPQPWEPVGASTDNSTDTSMEGGKSRAEGGEEGHSEGGEGGDDSGAMEEADEAEDAGPNLTDVLSGAVAAALSIQRKALGARLGEFVEALKHAMAG